MLGGQISNQDEAEVEDELAALQAELSGQGHKLPSVPNAQVPISERGEEEPAQEARQMLAA
jgi:charged multivesicular body protein 6